MARSKEYFDVALFIDNKATLDDVYHIMDSLDDSEICLDYSTLAFCSDGLYFEAKTYLESIEIVISRISKENHDYLHLDGDTMAD